MIPAGSTKVRGNPDLRRYVLPTEQVVLATRKHWAVLLRPILAASVVFVVAAALATAGPAEAQAVVGWLWLAFVAALAYLAYRWVEWRAEWFIATDRRLLLRYGVIVRKVAMMPLPKVTDMGYTRTPLGYLFGFGRFVLESAGQDQVMRQIDFVPRPDETYRTLCGELFGPAPMSDAGRSPITRSPITQPIPAVHAPRRAR